LKPDCSIYAKDYEKKSLDLSRVDFIIEFKSGSDGDPFVDPKLQSGEEKPNPFVCSEGPRRKNLGQITAYATSILSAQYRTHTFMVLIVEDYARLLRWDRAGTVVTEPIYSNVQPHLFNFLIRYDIADREARGHDSTVKFPHDNEIADAKTFVPELAQAKSFLAVDILDQRYILHGPELQPDVPVGRWTRTSFAYSVKEGRRVLLKDSWRILLDDIKPEGDIYRKLHQGQVPNIPSCLSDEDVGDDTHHRSRMHEVIDEYITRHPCWKLTLHRHYRIVLGTIGKRLENFKHTREFVNAMYAALKGKMTTFSAASLCNCNLTHIIAHKAAYDVGVLHRDISPGNILIADEDGLDSNNGSNTIDGGMLIDWDLSKIVNPNDRQATARESGRTVS
jgi:hypothetical protein